MSIFQQFLDFIQTDLIIVFLLSVLYSLGSLISFRQRLENKNYTAFNLFLGIFAIGIWGWSSYSVGSSLVFSLNIIAVISLICFLGIILIGLKTNVESYFFREYQNLKQFVLDALGVVTLCCLIFTYITSFSPHSVVTILKNVDLFNWSLVADYIKTAKGSASVIPNGMFFTEQNIKEGFGTFYLLAFLSKFLNCSTLEATTYILILITVINIFLVKEILEKFFDLDKYISFGISIISIINPFYVYLLFNHFFGYLFALIILYSFILNMNKFNEKFFFVDALYYMFFPIMAILLFYLAVVPFEILFLEITFIYNLYDLKKNAFISWTLKNALRCCFRISVCIFVSLLVLPKISQSLFDMLLIIGSIQAGWPLPRFDLAQLIIPSLYKLTQLSNELPKLSAFFTKVMLETFCIIVLGLVIFFKVIDKKLRIIFSKFFLILILNIVAYYVFFYFKGTSYQVWKLISYIILPFSFVYLTLLYFGFKSLLELFRLSKKQVRLITLIIIGVYFFGKVLALINFTFTNYDSTITQFKNINNSLELKTTDNNLFLGLDGDTLQLAMCMLNDKFHLIINNDGCQVPAPSEIFIKSLDIEKTYILLANPAKNIIYYPYNVFSFKELKQIELKKIQQTQNFSELQVLNPFNIIQLRNGFAGVESWGVWTDGNNATMSLSVPKNLTKFDLFLKLKISPFIIKNKFQEFDVIINGVKFNTYKLKTFAEITLNLPKDAENFDIVFKIKRTETIPNDNKKFGLGFISYNLVYNNN